MPRQRYKHNVHVGRRCLVALVYIIGIEGLLFFIYCTLHQANKQAYLDYYYPDLPIPKQPPQDRPLSIANDKPKEEDKTCASADFERSTKYDADLHNDPTKHLLLTSLFNTLDNTKICQLFASKPKMQWTWDHVEYPNVYCLVYDDGGYSYHLIHQILSNVFDVSYQIMDIDQQCPNVQHNDKLILWIRNPFDAISMHVWLHQLVQSSTEMVTSLSDLSNFWCTMDAYDKTLNTRHEAQKWKNMIEYVLNDYLKHFGNTNVLMLQIEDLTSEWDNDEDRVLSLLEQYFTIANFLFDGDEMKMNENKFGWITKIICELESNKQLLQSMHIPIPSNRQRDTLDCTIWNVVQNYASLYQYFPSTLNCI
eukprot:45503_1